MVSFETFKQKFVYDSAKTGFVGIERELFIVNRDGAVVPMAYTILHAGGRSLGNEFGYELSACQIEARVGPNRLEELKAALYQNNIRLNALLWRKRCRALHAEVGPEHMPLTVYPDPNGRYRKLAQGLGEEALRAACRVAGTHVHIGMPDHERAVRVHDALIPHVPRLCRMGDYSGGERLSLYRVTAPDCDPEPLRSLHEYYHAAVRDGFAADPRKCWKLIRVSIHGTLEFRMFGATESHARICEWTNECHRLCMGALRA